MFSTFFFSSKSVFKEVLDAKKQFACWICSFTSGKGFAIGSAGLVALSLYGAFVTRASNATSNHNLDHPISANGVNLEDPIVFSGLLIGAMLPYAFSALTMKSVGAAALKMV